MTGKCLGHHAALFIGTETEPHMGDRMKKRGNRTISFGDGFLRTAHDALRGMLARGESAAQLLENWGSLWLRVAPDAPPRSITYLPVPADLAPLLCGKRAYVCDSLV
jgi:hypothetical protein